MKCNMTVISRESRSIPVVEPISNHERPLPDDGGSDIAGYNKELEQLGNPKWFSVPWLFSECYLYRSVFLVRHKDYRH